MTTPTIETLDPLSIPLNGVNLIEASAGTGKTYTITTLFIRLILEKKLTVDRILVVTFTKAATEELRDRIRNRLRETLTAFQQGTSPDDILVGLLQKYGNHSEAIFSLTNALRGFDEAAIQTIHSFCQQMLQENAFESGVLFDSQLLKDQSHFLREIVEDFWRQNFYHISDLFITYALTHDFQTPEQLLKSLNQTYIGQPFLKIIPEKHAFLTKGKEVAFSTAFLNARKVWQSGRDEIQSLLIEHEGLSRTQYRIASISKWCEALDFLFVADNLSINLPENLSKFTRKTLASSLKKNHTTPPQHDFFSLCETLQDCQQHLSDNFEQHLLTLKIKLFDVAKTELALKKQEHHVLSFDDLLNNLHEALQGAHGETLARVMRQKYQAALIDEFQDTDPVQYDIFHRIYGAGKEILFLIGDPKQAIYSFRGADIFTYMQAYRDAKRRYTLGTNWRSQKDLITGINTLFEQTAHPFLFEDIPFQAVQAPLSTQQATLKIENKPLPPLQFWFVSKEDAQTEVNKGINKGWGEQHIPLSVAYEISRLLMSGDQGLALIGDKPVVAGDIAILVRSNYQGMLMQKTLTKLRIPSVLYSRDNLFQSSDIKEVARLLLAVSDVSNEGLIKAALTTDMIGMSGDALYALIHNDREWQRCLRRFQKYHYLWRHLGFIQMYRTLLLQEQVSAHLLRYPDGERRLTNILHVAELLQQATVAEKLGMTGLCQWLTRQCHPKGAAPEEQQLRLESDENLVKIVTIHNSKGLEYPIVFCPFAWDGKLHNKETKQFIFHDAQDAAILDLGSSQQEQHRLRAIAEERAENLRIFYVAVTRAKHRCYLIWGSFKKTSDSPLAHLLCPGMDTENEPLLLKRLTTLAQGKPWKISPMPLDATPYHRSIEKTETHHPRQFLGHIDKGWKVSSFTSLSRATAIDQPDYDDITLFRPREPTLVDKNHIYSFPRGARAGNFMHALFEHLDFTQTSAELTVTQLRNFGYPAEKWQDVIQLLIDNVLNTPLDPQHSDLRLSQITRNHRLNELEFYYPLAPQGLEKAFAQFGYKTEFNRLALSPVRGFMKGYIDMVFEYQGKYYLVDYKSNLIGTHQDDYAEEHLNTVMRQEGYILQYHIYVVALHRYLSSRIPNYSYDHHFGGVYYLFLRGMTGGDFGDFGVFRDRPSQTDIHNLSLSLGGDAA